MYPAARKLSFLRGTGLQTCYVYAFGRVKTKCRLPCCSNMLKQMDLKRGGKGAHDNSRELHRASFREKNRQERKH